MIRLLVLCRALLLVMAASLPLLGQRPGGAGASTSTQTANGIDGRTIDAQGRPVPFVFLTLLQEDRTGKPAPLSRLIGAVSDQQGRFSFSTLRPGGYVVAAIPSDATSEKLISDTDGFRTTYFPSAATVAAAKFVPVSTRERSTAVITMLPAKLSKVSGIVTLSNGKPPRGGKLNVGRGDGFFGFASFAVPVRDDGSFELTRVPPGTFFLHFRETPWPPPRGQEALVSGATVVTRGVDLPGTQVRPIPVLSVRGRVVLEGGTRDQLRPAEVSLAAVPYDFEGNPGPIYPATLRDDLSFELRAYAAHVRVRVTLPDRQWRMKHVRLDGVDVTTAGFELRPGVKLGMLEVVIEPTATIARLHAK